MKKVMQKKICARAFFLRIAHAKKKSCEMILNELMIGSDYADEAGNSSGDAGESKKRRKC